MKNFALIGAAGFVAPRHMQAIKDTDNVLLAAMDKHDSVGIIDNFFPKAAFFTEFERFDRHLDLLKREGKQIDFLSVCTPNYLHDAHIRFGLRVGANVICEKPLVLNPWNVEAIKTIEKESKGRVYNVLQLRYHPEIIKLKERIDSSKSSHTVDLKYITSRGSWYDYSWKGDVNKSGGIASNIGVHFFDMLTWVFGKYIEVEVTRLDSRTLEGVLTLQNAKVNWLLSIDEKEIPSHVAHDRTYRSLTIDGQEIDFSNGFTNLHTRCYQEILNGNGLGVDETASAIAITHDIREQTHGR